MAHERRRKSTAIYLSAVIRKLGVRNRFEAIDPANGKGWL